MKILVTAGATREPIDSVRYISNMSTGKTGAIISEFLLDQGDQIVHLSGAGAFSPQSHPALTHMRYNSFSDLDLKLKHLLSTSQFDAVIHSAAVSDFSLLEPIKGKMSSEADKLTLKLKRNPKIVSQLLHYSSNPKIKVIAFKLTDTRDEAIKSKAIHKLTENSVIHLVVHNDLSEVTEHENHLFNLYQGDSHWRSVATKQELAFSLYHFIHGDM